MRVRKSGTSAKYFSSIPPQDGDQPSFAFRYGSPLFVLAALTFYGCAAGFNNDEVLQDSLSITDGASHDFGNSTVGKSADKTLTVQNKSRFDIYLLDLTPEKAKFSDDFKVTGGTCTQTSVLTTGSDCSLSLSFNPKSKGEVTGVLPIGFQDDFISATLALTLRGYAKNPGILTLSELGSYDFGERGLLSESTHVFTLSNSGEAPITFRTLSTESLSLSAPFKRATSGATCATGSTLAVSNTCLLPIVFAPSQSGVVRQVLNIPYYNDSSTTALSLAIRGTGGSVSLLSLSENSPFNFGDVPIGSSSTHVFTLTQLEGVGAVLGDATSSALLSLTAPFSFLGGSCSNGLRLIASSALTDSADTSSLSSSCTLSVAFTPTQANLETQTLQLSYYDGISNSTFSRDLRGMGVSPPSLVAVPAGTYDYGTRTVGTTTSKSFQLVNQGQASTTLGTITGASIGSSSPFSLSGGTCTTGSTLGPLTGSCTLIIDYVPTTAILSTQSLSISYLTGTSATTSSLVSFGVKGTGQFLAELTISDASHYSYGNNSVGSVSTRVFTLTNSSAVAAVLGNVATSGNVNLSAPYSRSGGTCANSQTLSAGGGSCTVEISYSPTLGGVSTTQLSISYHNGTSQTYLLQGLGGVGVGRAAIAISPSGYDHGSKVISTVSTSVFTLSNTGGSTATFGSLADAGLGLSSPFSKTGGSCSSSGTLTSGSSCTLTLAFTPVAATSSTSVFTIVFSDQGGTLSSTASISGTGINGAALSYSDSPSFDFGSVTVDLTSVRTFTITNSGTNNGTLGTISTNDLGLSAPFSLTGGSCASGATITLGGGTCTLEVTASPTSAGLSSTQISLAYQNGGGMISALLPLAIQGLSHSVLSLTPLATFDFGNVPIGGSSNQTFTVTNQGQTSATLGTINTANLNLSAPFSHTGGTCSSSGTVAPSATCTLTIQYSPVAQTGSQTTLSLNYTDLGGTARPSTTHALQGTGVTPAALAITPSGSFNFGSQTVGLTTTQAFTITNSGSTSATLGTIDTAGLGLAAPFTLSSGTCASSGTVAAASSCVITLSFAPSSAVNSNVSLSVAYNDGVAAQSTTKDLGGLGITPATLTISDGPTYDYGSKVLTTATSKIFTINNTGATAAALGTLNSANLNLSAPFSYNSTTCGASITAGGNCTITADFTPSAATTSSAILSLAYNNGVSSTSSTRDLNGTGISQAALALTPSGSFNFGSKTLTTTTTQTFTLTNSGQATATLGTISTAGLNLGAPFTHSGGNCSSAGTLAASASCTIAVDYTPTNATNSNAVLSVAYSDEASSKSTTKDLGGMGLSRALLAITPGPTVGFGSKTVTTTTSLALTITNSGASTATLGTISTAGLGLTGSDFGFQSGTCASSGTLSPESTCVITTSFTPGSSGAKSKTLALDYSDAGGSLSAANSALEGTGLTAATLAITPAGVHDFGEVGIGNTSSQTFTVSNTGQTDATLTDISNAGLFLSSTPFSLASSTCSTSATLTGGSGDCTVTVEFAPTSAISSTVTFSISYDNGLAQTTAGATVQGTGINLGTPALTLSPLAYHFGSVLAGDNSSIKTFTFTNSGDGVASGCSAPTITGGDGKLVITQDGCGTASLAASSSCTVSLQVQGPVLGSTYSATLTRACTDTSINTIENGLRFKGTHSIAVRDIATGYYHTCATLMDGSMKCWGYNSEGQLGYGDSTPRGGSGGSMASLNTLNLGSGVRAVEIAAGYYHTCAILDTGDTKCWGRNAQGQLGQDHASSYGASNSETPSALSAINIGTDRKTRSIAAGQSNTCAIRDDGELKCWGDYPALGFTGDNTPNGDASGEMSSLAVVTLDDNGTIHKALNVGIGKDNGCAATDRGKLFCWGSNANGEAGQDTSSANFTPSILPNVGYYTRATKVKVNENFACAIDEVTGLSCWGSCVGYELGNGCPTNATVGVNSGDMATLYGPMYVSVKDLRLGYQTGCGLSYNGKLSCWGSSHHVLGNGVAAAAESATEVSLGSHRVRNFDLYREHACAVFGDGGLRCWGKDQFGDGMLGRDDGLSYGANSTTELATMTPVNLGVKIGPIDVGMSTYHTCAVLNDGNLKCWGYGLYGGLGLGDGVTRGNQPWDMETLPEVNLGTGNYAASVSHGLQHTCVTLVTGEVKCFGAGGNGRLGQNHDDSLGVTSANEVATLTAVNTSGTFLRNLQVGDYHNCGVTDYGNAYCWGYNGQGQLGLNDTTDRGTALDPMAWWMVNDGSGSVYTSIAAGYIHTCGATIGGQVFCWGSGASGETGQDSTTNFGSGTGGLEVSSGLGALPVTGVTKIVAGGHHSCALDSSGQVKCWGDNSYGQLGNGSWNTMGNGTGDSISAVTAVNLGAGLRAIDIAAGTWHTCAILGDRSVKCWGYNSDGQLGYNDTTTRGTPSAPVSGLSAVNFGAGKKALKIFAGSSSNGTCVITTDGELKCWGLNDVGQLGQGSTLNWGSGASGSSLSDMPAVPLR